MRRLVLDRYKEKPPLEIVREELQSVANPQPTNPLIKFECEASNARANILTGGRHYTTITLSLRTKLQCRFTGHKPLRMYYSNGLEMHLLYDFVEDLPALEGFPRIHPNGQPIRDRFLCAGDIFNLHIQINNFSLTPFGNIVPDFYLEHGAQ